jgi:hypothetical protein
MSKAEDKRNAKGLARMKRTEENILTKRAQKKTKPLCNCRNHKGTKKAMYQSRELAVNMILSYHLKHGAAYEIYQCPKSEYFHVATKKKAK